MKLTKKHEMALQLMLEGNLSKSEIADTVQIGRRTLYNWLENDDFKAEYEERLAEQERMTRARIGAMTKKALDRQENILEKSRNDVAAAAVAKDVLDRAGFAPDNNVNVSSTGVVQIIDNIPDIGVEDDTA